MNTEATQRDPRPLHERIVSYLEGAGWERLEEPHHDFRVVGVYCKTFAVHGYFVTPIYDQRRDDINDITSREVALLDQVPVSQVTGRPQNRAEKSLFAYMMGGPVPGFFRGQPRQSKKPTVFTCDVEHEVYTSTTKDHAIDEHLQAFEELPEVVTVYGFAREMVDRGEVTTNVECFLERALETLDERYGDILGNEKTYPCLSMLLAASKFAEAIANSYEPFTTVQVSEDAVDVRTWLKEHKPEWLDSRHPLCHLCGEVAHFDSDHVTNCECGQKACSSCISRIGGAFYCNDCVDEHRDPHSEFCLPTGGE